MSNEETTKSGDKPKRKRTLLQKIVNVFLYIGIVAFAILIFFFGFSQTQTFRNWLRDFVVETANYNLNGKISIEKIEGTIFTSLVLRNTIVTIEKDTLLKARLIELKTSPLRIFLKKIYVRKAEIVDTRIAFVEDSLGELNISKLFPPSEETDTAKSSFPFRIEVADFKLTNVSFSLQRYDMVGSTESYSSLNMNDFRVEDIFLSLKAFADIDNNTFEVKIDHMSFMPNLIGFNLKSLSGEVGLNPREIIVNNLNVNTTNSQFTLNVKVDNLNIFDSTFTEKMDEALLNVTLNSSKFNFDDLTAFVSSTDMLKGDAKVQLQASGTIKQLDVNKIIIDYEKTHLENKAVIRNLFDVDNMTISTVFKNSYIGQSDINKLLPEYGIPVFEKLGLVKVDSLSFDGNPLNFNTNLMLSTADGKITSEVKMNLEKEITEYDIKLTTRNFNLAPIANISSNLNIKAKFVGRGFTPEEMNANISIVGDASVVEGLRIDSLSLISQAKEGIINYFLITSIEEANTEINGSLDFTKENIGYKAEGVVSNLDLGKLMKDTTTATDLNFKFKTEGEDFDVDNMNMYLTLDISRSVINGKVVDSIRTITDISTDINEERVVNFISDIVDVTLKGKFKFSELLSTLSEEINLGTNSFKNKMAEIFPSSDKSENIFVSKNPIKGNRKKEVKKREDASVIYLVDLKDFGIISLFLQNRRLEIDGDLSGNIDYNSDDINISFNTNLNYVKFWGGEDVFFIAKFNSSLNFKNSFDAQSTKDMILNLKAETNRVFTGTDLNNIFLNFNLKHDIASIKFSGKLEDYAFIKLSSLADLRGSIINFELDTLDLNYNGFDLKNRDKLNVVFSQKRIDINKFRLFHSDAEITAEGFLASNEEQNLNLKISNLQGKDLIKSFSKGNGLSFLDINLSLDAQVTGNYSNPMMNINLNGEDLRYKEKIFGRLASNFHYKDKTFYTDVELYNVLTKSSLPSLRLNGNFSVDLSFTGAGKRLLDNEDISFNLTAHDFELTPFGELIPGVSKFKGNLNCDLEINGSITEPYPAGYLKLGNSSFLLKYNNLEYKAGIKISVAKDFFSLDSLLIANSDETKFGGKITGGGKAELDNLDMTSSQFAFNGSLKVLGDESKYVSPNLYGDLVISTNGNFDLSFDKTGAKLKAPISIDIAKLTYSSVEGYYGSPNESFIYKFVEDTITKNSKTIDFDELINLSKLNESEKIQQAAKPSKFDYSIDVKVENEAILTYILSREFNQSLVAVLSGNFQYESIRGKPVAQGELSLLEGSTLEFIKTFTAEGKIRFESELSNPYLDITATYKNYYYPSESSSSGTADQSSSEEVEIAIKMNIKGVLSELDKNLSQQSEKLTVYVGAKNIEENSPDLTKDASDAVMFMLLGKFNDNVTQQERNIVSSYAASFAGSIVGGFLNRQLGDVVKSLEIRQSGANTKFILAGRAGKFRYSIGGSTAVFQDLGLANVKIEYPITRSFFMRLERKEAFSENKYVDEMINEVGLKYRFEF